MKKIKLWSMMMLTLMVLPMMVACNSDDDNDDSDSSITVELTTANKTEDGYFDGMMYYKITSNSPAEVQINKADKSVINVEIPSNIKIDGKKYKCTSIGDYAFDDRKNLSSVTIPNSVTSIGHCAFRYCYSLTSVTIPNSMTIIKNFAFGACSNLTFIRCKAQTPPEIDYGTFNSGVPEKATLYIPKGSISAYQAKDHWKEFKNIVEE